MAELLSGRDFDYVVGSIHFVGDGALDYDLYDIWSAASSPEKVWRTYFEWLGQAAASGMFDILAHPDLVKYWGRPSARGPTGTCAASTRSPWRRSPRRASRSRSRPPGCASRSASCTRRGRFLEMVVEAGNPIALSSDAHAPEDLGRDYDQALELARRARGERAGGLRAARAAPGADRMTDVDGHRLGLAPARGRAPARSSAGSPSSTSSASTATPTPTCSPTRSSTRCSAPPRWATSASTSPTPTSATATPTRCCCCAPSSRRSPTGDCAIAHVDATVVMERPKLAPHRDAIRASLADGLGGGARAGQREGLDRRGDGLRGARRGRRRAGGGHGAEDLGARGAPDRADASRPRPARGPERGLGPADHRLPLAGPLPDPARRRRRGARLHPRHPRRAAQPRRRARHRAAAAALRGGLLLLAARRAREPGLHQPAGHRARDRDDGGGRRRRPRGHRRHVVAGGVRARRGRVAHRPGGGVGDRRARRRAAPLSDDRRGRGAAQRRDRARRLQVRRRRGGQRQLLAGRGERALRAQRGRRRGDRARASASSSPSCARPSTTRRPRSRSRW